MQFNTLGDGLGGFHDPRPGASKKTPLACLNFAYRGYGLIEEIVQYMPDVVTLQEVDHFDFMAKYLAPFGTFASPLPPFFLFLWTVQCTARRRTVHTQGIKAYPSELIFQAHQWTVSGPLHCTQRVRSTHEHAHTNRLRGYFSSSPRLKVP